MKYIYLYIVLFLSVANLTLAQNTSSSELDVIEITTKDGNIFTGKIIESDTKKIVIESASLGTITIDKANIENIGTKGEKNYSSTRIGDTDENYYNATRYLINSSGFTLKKGQKYYENIAVFFSSFAFGITDRFTLTVGGEVASLLFGQEFPILYFAPKYSVLQSEKINITIGATYFDSPGSYFNGFGAITSAITFGDRNNNFSIGPGFGYTVDNGFSDRSLIPINLAFMKKISNKVSLVSDSYLVFYESDVTGLISLAARVHFNNGASFNAGLWRILEDTNDIFVLPFVSALVPLGRK